VAAVLLGLYAGRQRLLPAVARFLDVSEPAWETDYVMVLGGDLNARPFAAAAFVNAGLARRVLVSNPKAWGEDLDESIAPEQERARQVLVHQGVPPDAVILLDKECASTFDEACILADFLAAEPDSTVTVITSGYHTRRTRLIFRKKLGSHAGRVHFLGAPTDGFDENNWWHFESGFQSYLNEYVKLAFYLVRY
jgi:uncharacterized SAM-binding protein YcdF (DUF218 family)